MNEKETRLKPFQETISEKFSMYGMGFRKSAATEQFSSLRLAVHLMPLPENLVGKELSLLTFAMIKHSKQILMPGQDCWDMK